LAVYNGQLAVGAPMRNGTALRSGAVYLYKSYGYTWDFEQEIGSSHQNQDGNFGHSVAISESGVTVGAPGEKIDQLNYGAVYVFTQLNEQWREASRIIAPDQQGFRGFGQGIALNHGRLFVGAPGAYDYVHSAHGAGYLFARHGTNWTSEAKLVPQRYTLASGFGGSVALRGGVAILAPVYARGSETLAQVFRLKGSEWLAEETFNMPDRTSSDDAARPVVAISDLYGAVGFPDDISSWPYSGGSVAMFRVESSDCNENGEPDLCELRHGARDCNRNEILDECEPAGFGDYDHDGVLGLRDGYRNNWCITGPRTPEPLGCCAIFDAVPQDSAVTLADFAVFQKAFGQ